MSARVFGILISETVKSDNGRRTSRRFPVIGRLLRERKVFGARELGSSIAHVSPSVPL
jgi:hypothetical protein